MSRADWLAAQRAGCLLSQGQYEAARSFVDSGPELSLEEAHLVLKCREYRLPIPPLTPAWEPMVALAYLMKGGKR